MNYSLRTYALLLISSLLMTSCGDDEPSIEIQNPTNYTFERDGASTVSFDGQTTRIQMSTELVSAMSDFNSTETSLLEMYANQTASGGDADPYSTAELNASTKSIKSKVAASADFFSSNTVEAAQIKEDFESWLSSQVNSVFVRKDELASVGMAGQIADGSSVRYVNSQGLEYNQMVNKALIGALMVDQLSNNYLSSAVLDEADNRELNDAGTTVTDKSYTNMEHKWDEAYGYLFGAASDASQPLLTLGEDNFLNKYLSRVEGDEDFAGIASDIFEAFKLGRAAIVAGDYEVRDEQAEIIRDLIGQVIGIRAVYYLQQGKGAFPSTGYDYGSAFHDLSEGLGFVYSLRFVREANSNDALFTRAEVDNYMDQLLAGNGFWEVTSETLDNISEDIASKFDFTVEQAGS